MAEMLSPGVFVQEIDASSIVPTVSNSVGVFAGDFHRGPVGISTLITSVADLLTFYGEPSSTNYNDFYAAYNFLQYGNKLLVSRAANINGTATAIAGLTVVAMGATDDIVGVTDVTLVTVGDLITFATFTGEYRVSAVDSVTSEITLDRLFADAVSIVGGEAVNSWAAAMNGVIEATSIAGVATTADEYAGDLIAIENAADYEALETSIAMSGADAKIKFITRSVGAWGSNVEIAIAKASAFGAVTPSLAFDGISLDDLFEYAPTGTEVGIVVRENSVVVETFTVSFDVAAKDHNNKSIYIENVINSNSLYIFAKDNTANTVDVEDYCFSVNGVSGSVLVPLFAADSSIQADDLLNAYELFGNKEEVDKLMSLGVVIHQ